MDAAAAAVSAGMVVTAEITYAVCGSPVVRAVTAAATTTAGGFIVSPPVEGDALRHREDVLPLDTVRI